MNAHIDRNTIRPEQVLQQRPHRLGRKKNQFRLIRNLMITVSLTYILFGVVFGIAFVFGQSMTPAFQDGDIVIFWRLPKHYRYGDVLVFRGAGEQELVKRVAAVPDDTVGADVQGRLLIKGQIVKDTYAKLGAQYPITLREKEYFVLGDNRQTALDSRNFGVVTERNIHGKVICVLRIQIRE